MGLSGYLVLRVTPSLEISLLRIRCDSTSCPESYIVTLYNTWPATATATCLNCSAEEEIARKQRTGVWCYQSWSFFGRISTLSRSFHTVLDTNNLSFSSKIRKQTLAGKWCPVKTTSSCTTIDPHLKRSAPENYTKRDLPSNLIKARLLLLPELLVALVTGLKIAKSRLACSQWLSNWLKITRSSFWTMLTDWHRGHLFKECRPPPNSHQSPANKPL